jgi:putative transposase
MILRDLHKQGLKPWRFTIAEGHWGLWAALVEQYPTLAEQRCWNHKIVNVLDALPKRLHDPRPQLQMGRFARSMLSSRHEN